MNRGKGTSTALRFFVLAIVLSSLLAILPILACADDVPRAKPEEVGMSTERLARIRPFMQSYVDRKLAPGAVTLVARKGKVVHFEAVGFRDVENKAEITADSIFRIASMTKPLTSVALMMLYEEGHFLLSDPIKEWLPEWSRPKVAVDKDPEDNSELPYKLESAKRPITIEHLLTHTAGLSNNYVGKHTIKMYKEMNENRQPGETIDDYSKAYAQLPLNYHPGESWQYSGATTIVGRLVEVISGMTLDEFLRERIFKPLGMNDTHFFLPEYKLDRFMACYEAKGKEWQIELSDPATAESRYVKPPHTFFSGAGGLVSTAKDYFRFSQMMLNKGELDGVRILGRKTVEFMTQNHTGDLSLWLPGPGYGFGLGFSVQMNMDHTDILTQSFWQKVPTTNSVGSFGWGGFYNTYFVVDPVEEMVIIMMSQVAPYTHLKMRKGMVGLAYQALID
jgi:CubicO group peptidase (beta-lactamase class C family)